MYLNTLKPANGSKHSSKRVGRGIGSGLGKTCGRGHKGQHARSGWSSKIGFEGGQMPLQRRLPKYGFVSRKANLTQQVRLSAIARSDLTDVTFGSLREKGLVCAQSKFAKIFFDSDVDRPITVRGVKVTSGSKAAIEKAGGKILEDE